MKCAIFLLTVCAFKTAFASDFEEELANICQSTAERIRNAVASFQSFAAVHIQRERGINPRVRQCMEEYHALWLYELSITSDLLECISIAFERENIQVGQQCFDNIINKFENEKNSRRSNFDKCMRTILAGRPYNTRPAAQHEAESSTSNQSNRG